VAKWFFSSLSYAGAFAAILLIIYPALMAWHGRYIINISCGYRVFGGKVTLLLAIISGIGVVITSILAQFKLLPVPELLIL
jgi:Tryptophan/tyrosine permease family.